MWSCNKWVFTCEVSTSIYGLIFWPRNSSKTPTVLLPNKINSRGWKSSRNLHRCQIWDQRSHIFKFYCITPHVQAWLSWSEQGTVNPGRAASGGALAPKPPRATRSQPELIWTVILGETSFFLRLFELSLRKKKLGWDGSTYIWSK